MNSIVDIGSDRGKRRRSRRRSPNGAHRFTVVGLALLAGLTACQMGSPPADGESQGAGGYPSLSSVPTEPRTSTPIEERRQIVRELIDERDRSRRQTALIRRRSGLSVDQLPMSIDDDIGAEDIIPDASKAEKDSFRLAPDDKVSADSIYRSKPQFEDGGLNDFIRQLKRDTSPSLPPETSRPVDEPSSDQPEEDDVSALVPTPPVQTGNQARQHHPILLAAFAPAIKETPLIGREVWVRLAAAEDEPGFFCNYMGWVVAWSSMCVDESAAEQPASDDQETSADLEQELRKSEDEETIARPTRSAESTSGTAVEERTNRRLSEEDAAEAIENAGRSALAPVASSLEKLRDFMDSRRSDDATSSSSSRTAAVRESARASPIDELDRPPLPESRPELREDVIIVDKGERFDFIRTPLPAFKPSPDEPVILPPEGQIRVRSKAKTSSGPPPKPRTRPNDLLSTREDEGAKRKAETANDQPVVGASAVAQPAEPGADADEAGAETKAADRERNLPSAASNRQATAPGPPELSQTDDVAKAPIPRAKTLAALSLPDPTLEPTVSNGTAPSAIEPMIILFEPGKQGLPEGIASSLLNLLQIANVQNEKIHIIGEAGTNHLARRRATDIGAALVQLGATVEILEYDHKVVNGADQVRLVLQPETPDPALVDR